MSKIYKGVMELVGSTPLVEVVNIGQQEKLETTLFVKLEHLNPAGNVRDQVGRAMIEDAERRGILKPGSMIIEPVSGSTGIGLASIVAAKGYRMMLTMPDTMNVKCRNILGAYGTGIVLTPGELGMTGAIEKAEELAKKIPGNFIPEQFMNPVSPRTHMETTGPEIWRGTQGKMNLLVTSVGTGGTITRAGTYLKWKNPDLEVIAMEPAASAVPSGKATSPHKIQDIGAGFVPEVLGTGIYDEIITADNDVPFAISKILVRTEGLLTGISSGAVLYVTIQAAKRLEDEGETTVTLLPDGGSRCYSTPLFVERR